MANVKELTSCVLSGGSGKECVPLPFSVFRGCLHSLAHGPFHHLQSPQWPAESFPQHVTLTWALLAPPFIHENPGDYIGPTRMILDPFSNLSYLISNLNSMCNPILSSHATLHTHSFQEVGHILP